MKVKLLKPIRFEGKAYKEGSVLEVPEIIGQRWSDRKIALASKKKTAGGEPDESTDCE